MCGITGYVGGRSAVSTAIENLKRLEYRGYDSAGVAYPGRHGSGIQILKAAGKIRNLERQVNGAQEGARVAVAHTRWATHGRPNEANAHPHRDCSGKLAVVHNGIVENYAELREQLRAQGHEFTSETDTEVIAHLIESYLTSECPTAEEFVAGARAALSGLRGSYAVAVVSEHLVDAVLVARKDSPLVIGLGEGENFLASDIPAVMKHTRKVALLEDGDFAIIRPNEVSITGPDGRPVVRTPIDVTWDDQAAEKAGYSHFMLK